MTPARRAGGNTCREQNQSVSFWDRCAKNPAPAPDAGNGGFFCTGDQTDNGNGSLQHSTSSRTEESG